MKHKGKGDSYASRVAGLMGKAGAGSGDLPERFSKLAGMAVKDRNSGKPSWVTPAAWAKRRSKKA